MIKIRAINWFVAIFMFFLWGCEPNKKNRLPSIEPKCIASQSPCLVKSPSSEFSVLFNKEKMITETPFDIFLISEGEYKIENISAYMEGKHMFMGRIPLFFESLPESSKLLTSEKNTLGYIANTMLGSCSEESMRWIVYFEINLLNHQNKSVTERFSVEFDSIRGF